MRIIAAAAVVAVFLSAAGCGGSPSVSPAPTATPYPRPDVSAAPGKLSAPKAAGYEGFALKVKPAHGQELILKDSSAVQLVMDAWQTDRLQVKGVQGRFSDKLTVLGADGKPKYVFSLASDGQMLLKAQDGRVFLMPEYVYYLLENSLWTFGASLMDGDVKWQPDKGTATLELELPRLVNSAMLPAFGYSLAYFTSYKIYGVNTDTRNTAKVYLLATYAGYDVDGQNFSPKFLYTTPMTLIFTTTGGNLWKLTALKQPVLMALQAVETPTPPSGTPAPTTDSTAQPAQTAQQKLVSLKGQALYDSIRTIFPFDYMESVTDDMNGKTSQLADMQRDIVRQATEYLNEAGIEGLNVES